MHKFKINDVVQLTQEGTRSNIPDRIGIVVGFSPSGTQVRVMWDDIKSPQ